MNICNKIKLNNKLLNYNKNISIRSYQTLNNESNNINNNNIDNNSDSNNIIYNNTDNNNNNQENKNSILRKFKKPTKRTNREYPTGVYSKLDDFSTIIGENKIRISNSWRGQATISAAEGQILLTNLGGDYEKQINLVEDRNEEIMNAYYSIVDEPKHIGTFFFYGSHSDEFNIWNAVESYFGFKLVDKDTFPQRIVIIHCKRNKNGFSFYEKFNIDGSRNFIKKDISQFASDIQHKSGRIPNYATEYLISTPNLDNLTLIISPQNHLNLSPYENEKNEKDLFHLYRIYNGNIYIFPILRIASSREVLSTRSLDPLGVFSNPIISTSNLETSQIMKLLPPRSDEPLYYDPNNLSAFGKVLKNRIYKVFFRNNENYLKSIISDRFKNSNDLLLYHKKACNIHSFELSIKRYSQSWDKNSIALKLVLRKYIEDQLNKFFYNEINNKNDDITIQISAKSLKSSVLKKEKLDKFNSCYKDISISSVLKDFERLLDSNKDDENSSSKLVLEFKDEWIFSTQNLRSQEFVELYKKDYINMYKKSLDQVREVEATSSETQHFRFYELWNILYKRVITKLLIDNLISILPYNLLDETVKIISERENLKVFTLSVLADDFKKNLNSEYIEQLISKETQQSVSFEQFREILLEDFTLNNNAKEIKINAFSNEWNYIYFRAISRKLSNEILNSSMSNVILPFFFEIIQFNILNYDRSGSRVLELYDKNITDLLKHATFIKENLNFKSKKELQQEKERQLTQNNNNNNEVNNNNQNNNNQ